MGTDPARVTYRRPEILVLTVPRPDAARVLAGSWHNLQHPDGRPRRLMHFSNFGQTPQAKLKTDALADELGTAAIHTLEGRGYTITHESDPKPADAEGYKLVALECRICGKQFTTIGVNENMTAKLSTLAMRVLAGINPECPHG